MKFAKARATLDYSRQLAEEYTTERYLELGSEYFPDTEVRYCEFEGHWVIVLGSMEFDELVLDDFWLEPKTIRAVPVTRRGDTVFSGEGIILAERDKCLKPRSIVEISPDYANLNKFFPQWKKDMDDKFLRFVTEPDFYLHYELRNSNYMKISPELEHYISNQEIYRGFI
jgi:hypothetical protein